LDQETQASVIKDLSMQTTLVKQAPIDTDTKHRNNCIKQGIKNLQSNVTENAVQRSLPKESPQTSILGNLEDSIKWMLQYDSFKAFQNLD